MNRTPARTIFVVALALLAIGFTGCRDKDDKGNKEDKPANKEAKWLGTYKNSKDHSTLVLQPDHKATLDMAGSKGDITWEVAGDDKIIVHAGFPISLFQNSDGSLRDEESTVWKKT